MTLTHYQCEQLMSTARDPYKGKPMKNNTRLYKLGDHYGLELHGTMVLRIYVDGWVLSAGGWTTVTTKARLNEFGPARISQRDWTWYVASPDGDKMFHNGIFVDLNHNVWDSRAHYLHSLTLSQPDDISEVVE
jgi:hypothetical protein